jgi:hypothetical protein
LYAWPWSGYARSKFHTWDTGADRCNTREAVLKRHGRKVKTNGRCEATSVLTH